MIREDRSRENDFAVGGGLARRHSGNRGECRVVRRSGVQFHLVADRISRVQVSARSERAHPAEMHRSVLGRWLLTENQIKKKKHFVGMVDNGRSVTVGKARVQVYHEQWCVWELVRGRGREIYNNNAQTLLF